MEIKWQSHAAIQLTLGEEVEASSARVVYAITSYMDSVGMMPCDSGSSERTVAFVDTAKGFTIYDEFAERGDLKAMDELGICLSGKFRTNAIGVISHPGCKMLRLYINGKCRDIFCSSKDVIDGISCPMRCNAQAKRWISAVGKGYKVENLSDAFLRCKEDINDGYKSVKTVLSLDDSVDYGFSSYEIAPIKGAITLHFCAANKVRQSLIERLFPSGNEKRRLVGNAIKSWFYRYSWGN